MNGSSDLVFIDTNVLVYFRDPRDQHKQAVSAQWLTELARSRRGRVSAQVLIEFYVVATNSAKLGRSVAAARADVESFAAWNPVLPDLALFRQAWQVSDTYAVSWWDSMIIAAALVARCGTLLSEDMQHGLVVNDMLTIRNPFAPG